jgi:flagellar assembly protein FliH
MPPVPVIDPARELELEAELQVLRQQVGHLVTELASARARILEDAEPEVVRLALSVAGRVIGREVAIDPPVVLGWVREGLSALPGRDAPALVVAPDIADAIPLELLSEEVAGGKVTVDATLRPGCCELREGATIVPIGAAERLAAISDALGVDKDRS